MRTHTFYIVVCNNNIIKQNSIIIISYLVNRLIQHATDKSKFTNILLIVQAKMYNCNYINK